MGIAGDKIYFENNVPTFKEIKLQFREVTGLELKLKSDILLNEFPGDLNIIELLQRDSNQYLDLKKEIIARHKYQELDNLDEIVSYCSRSPYFHVFNFDEITFDIEENKYIELNWPINSNYFPLCLVKTLINLGGVIDDDPNNLGLKAYSKRWKKLKPWYQYNWYNRPRK